MLRGLQLIQENDYYKAFSEDMEKKISEKIDQDKIPMVIEEAKKRLEDAFSDCNDFIIREITWGGEPQTRILIVFIEGLVDKVILNRDIILPIISVSTEEKYTLDTLKGKVINNCEIAEVKKFSEAVDSILFGNAVLYINGEGTAINTNINAQEGREIGEPDTEAVIRGPREGFVENIKVNTVLIRKKIRDTELKVENMRIGSRTKTLIEICYIKGLAREETVEEVKRRLKAIQTDAILESGYIEEFIEDKPSSILATITNTQKPDIVAARILEGRVAILVDGTPHVLTVPHLFVENIQVNEDYYQRYYIGTFSRLIRVIAIFISILLPGLYVALQTFHAEMIPTVLVVSMAGAREGIPFPSIIEAFIMTFAFELLRESGVRLPRPIGSAISIVGALIIGEAAVNAGLVGAPMVIVTALTGISSFIVPSLTEAMTIYRFILLFLGGSMGLYGITCGLYIIIIQALSLESFGIPYMETFAPFRVRSMQDTILRFPLRRMRKGSIFKQNRAEK